MFGIVFLLLKVCGEGEFDYVFFLIVKIFGCVFVFEVVMMFGISMFVLLLCVLEFVVCDKVCEYLDNVCYGELCFFVKGFYDWLLVVCDVVIEVGLFDCDMVCIVVFVYDVCLYYLVQEFVCWLDMVIGDYNYYYDGSVMLYMFVQQNQWCVGVFVDEVYNLFDCVCKMYSVLFDLFVFVVVWEVVFVVLCKVFDWFVCVWGMFNCVQVECYVVYFDVLGMIVLVVQNFVVVIGEYLIDVLCVNGDVLLCFYFEVIQFGVLVEVFDSVLIFDVMLYGELMLCQFVFDGVVVVGCWCCVQLMLCVCNVILVGFLVLCYVVVCVIVLFFGMLSLFYFYCDMLGLFGDMGWFDVDGLFCVE